MLKYILTPVDGSKLSEGVLPYVSQLGKALKLPVVLLHSVDPGVFHAIEQEPRSPSVPIGELPESYSEEFRQAIQGIAAPTYEQHRHYLDQIIASEKAIAESYLLRLSEALRKQDLVVEWAVEVGKVPDVILRFADEREGGLIAMATHGRSGLERWAMGSVAEKVLQGAKVPALFIRPHDTGESAVRLGNIVVPLDGSQLSESVLPLVVELDRLLGVPVRLMRVIHTVAEGYGEGEPYANPSDLLSMLEKEAGGYLERVKGRLVEQGIMVDTKVTTGPADGRIVDSSSEDSLIVMATHGRSGIRRFVLGSVTDKVVRTSGRAVLVFRPEDGT